MSSRMTSRAIRSAISSQALVDGHLLSELPDGATIDLFGQVHAPASLTRSPALLMAERKAKAMNGISGLFGQATSESVALQLSLESKLRARLAGDGGTRFAGTWKRCHTPARRHLCQLVPLKPIMKERGYLGLPTPAARDGKDISRSTAFLSQRLRHSPSLATHSLESGVPWQAITAIYCLAMGFPLLWNEMRPRDTVTQLSRKSKQSS